MLHIILQDTDYLKLGTFDVELSKATEDTLQKMMRSYPKVRDLNASAWIKSIDFYDDKHNSVLEFDLKKKELQKQGQPKLEARIRYADNSPPKQISKELRAVCFDHDDVRAITTLVSD